MVDRTLDVQPRNHVHTIVYHPKTTYPDFVYVYAYLNKPQGNFLSLHNFSTTYLHLESEVHKNFSVVNCSA